MSEFKQELDRLIRRERGRLVARLVAHIGGHQLTLAEDVAQDALLAAVEQWPWSGVPDNPAAWLHRVATNRAIDRLRRESREIAYDAESDEREVVSSNDPLDDAELSLMFLCCHSSLPQLDQLVLTLKTVSGFTAKESALVLLQQDAAVGQRLARLKRKLREEADPATGISVFEMNARLPTVLKVIYLMFAVGYFPRQGESVIRRDIAMEAIRLVESLATRNWTRLGDVHALAALLSFQASRFNARTNPDGELVLLADQDRNLWDTALIRVGMTHLANAKQTHEVSRYHLEAGIAALHATARTPEECDWNAIVEMYQQLVAMTNSPVARVDLAVATCEAGNPAGALSQLEALEGEESLSSYVPFHLARADVLTRLARVTEAKHFLQRARRAPASDVVIKHIESRLLPEH